MTDAQTNQYSISNSRGWIRLRTLVILRWWAIPGQLTALIVAQQVLQISLAAAFCYFIVGLSVISNIVSTFVFPENRRLSDRETFSIVLFDMVQLSILLYLTGGLNNPFSILIVGPVTVSASALSTRSTVTLGILAIVVTSLLTQFFEPLRTVDGRLLEVPGMLLIGNWVAIIIAVCFLGAYSRWVVSEVASMSQALQATQMALAREQKLTDLGGVVAAAAHELGTPLATIKLASSELASELADDPDLHDDAVLIAEQADRCRDILRSMGRAGKDDLHMRHVPLSAVLEEAADPHRDRGKELLFEIGSRNTIDDPQPTIERKPEVVHGLRNLIQNAVDFSRSYVWIESVWDEASISVRIMDDGKGYPMQLFGRIGDPFMRRRVAGEDQQRPEYEGMGLGLFIAKTLLERTGAELSFANGSDATPNQNERVGAIVEVKWPREKIELAKRSDRRSLGPNEPITS
ncbi:MAG: ActS/PrrB/RegB family redox-sensitive histidine kinase [Pseudomonadota bacterium]